MKLFYFIFHNHCIAIISECFDIGQNSFEQLCINFINEKVRKFATNRLIADEILWYKMEGIDIPQNEFLDNQNVIGK